MNIIIPLGGTGERFKSKGFKEPKPLINILDKKTGQLIYYFKPLIIPLSRKY